MVGQVKIQGKDSTNMLETCRRTYNVLEKIIGVTCNESLKKAENVI